MIVIVVVVATARAVDVAFLGLDRLLQRLAGHLAVGNLRLAEQEIDDLVLVQRRAQLGGRHRLLLDILDEALAVRRAVLLRGLRQQLVHFLLRDLDAIGGPDFRQEQAQAHAALGDRAIVATLGFQRSGFAVSLALVLLMIPVIVRSTEEMLRIVPMDLREASYALGVPKWKTISAIVIPTALSGIVTGILLALARVMGETAPLLILVGYAQAMNFDMFSGFMGSLPGMMYDQTSAGAGANPVPTDRLWGAAFTLIVLIALLNVGARFIAKFFAPKKV